MDFVISIMDAHKTWFAFLSAEVIERCMTRIKDECQGCKIGLRSPLLHYHNHFSLHEAMKAKMPEIALQMDIQKIFNAFLIKIGLFDLPEDEFVKLGQCFVRFSTPDAIYYGNYITKENEHLLYDVVDVEYEPTPIKAVKRQKTVISENDFSGTDPTS